MPKRFSASSAVTDDNACDWTNIGKLWLLSEFEVAGATVWGSMKYGSAGNSVQYPIFANNMRRVMGTTPGGRDTWWSLSAMSGSTAGFSTFGSSGYIGNAGASNNLRGPVCFRVT